MSLINSSLSHSLTFPSPSLPGHGCPKHTPGPSRRSRPACQGLMLRPAVHSAATPPASPRLLSSRARGAVPCPQTVVFSCPRDGPRELKRSQTRGEGRDAPRAGTGAGAHPWPPLPGTGPPPYPGPSARPGANAFDSATWFRSSQLVFPTFC